MQVTRTPQTQHIGLNIELLKLFLVQQQFDPEIINELVIMLLPITNKNGIDDAFYDEHALPWTIFVPCLGKDATTIQRDLLEAIRREVLEEAQAPWDNCAAEQSWNTWGQPDEESQDVETFAASAPVDLVFFDLSIHPLLECDVVLA